MMLRRLAVALLLTVLSQSVAVAQTDAPGPSPVDELAPSIRSFAAAFNAGNATQLAAHFTDDGEYVADNGTLFKGREDIEAEFAAFFEEFPKSQLAVAVSDIRLIGDKLAVEEGTARVTRGTDGVVTSSRYVVTHVRAKDGWLIASARDLDAQPATNHDRLKALEWLVGDWVDESKASTVATSVRWSEDGNFLMARFELRVEGLRVMNGTQRIGWDPQKKQIRSWVFDSEGGFGTGFWTATENGWLVKSSFALPDGGSGSVTSTYERTGRDAFRLTFKERLVDGELLPSQSVSVVRRPPEAGQ
jgi:uncharacterized protein (TIGR02246 family)